MNRNSIFNIFISTLNPQHFRQQQRINWMHQKTKILLLKKIVLRILNSNEQSNDLIWFVIRNWFYFKIKIEKWNWKSLKVTQIIWLIHQNHSKNIFRRINKIGKHTHTQTNTWKKALKSVLETFDKRKTENHLKYTSILLWAEVNWWSSFLSSSILFIFIFFV